MTPVDWDKLLATNADVYAWIRVPGTNIDYPILQASTGKDDDFYLHHDIKKKLFVCRLYLYQKSKQKRFIGPFNSALRT